MYLYNIMTMRFFEKRKKTMKNLIGGQVALMLLILTIYSAVMSAK